MPDCQASSSLKRLAEYNHSRILLIDVNRFIPFAKLKQNDPLRFGLYERKQVTKSM
jgi:hypothetical protein